MQGYKPEDTRTLAIVAHSGAGKTSLIEALLYKAGVTSRLGKVDDGTSIADYSAEEKERKVTIYAKPLHCTHNGRAVFIMDTPGYADFFGEVISSLRVVDGAILVVDGTSGIQVGTQRVWKKLVEQALPRIIFINKLDKENSDFLKVLGSLREVFGKMCVPVQVPMGQAKDFKGMVDLVNPSGGLPAEAEEYKKMLTEAVAETDDQLLEKYLERGELEREEVISGLKKAVIENRLIPVMGGAAVRELGVSELLNAIENYLPSPADRSEVKGLDEEVCRPYINEPYSAFIFKAITDPYVGHVTFLRVYSGIIKSDSQVFNANRKTKEKIGQLMLLLGKEQRPIPEAGPGDIVAVTKLKTTTVNDTFSSQSKPIRFEPIVFPKPSISFAVQPHSKGDEEKISNGLQRLAEEDHTFEVHRDRETKELVVSGMGDLHLDIVLDKLKRKFGVEVDKSTPKVAYKETIRVNADGHEKYKRQTGGHGQYGEVYLRLESLERGKGFEFADEIVGGVIPKGYIPAVEKGVVGAMEIGVVAGYPVVDVKVVLYDGSYHEVDSSEMAFKIAGSKAFKDAMRKANPVLLEPIMNVEVYMPPEFMGDVTGDLTSKRGRVIGMDQMGDLQVIKAQVPIAEIARYSTELRSITGGRGSFTMEFSHYEEVPGRLTQGIVAKVAKAKEDTV